MVSYMYVIGLFGNVFICSLSIKSSLISNVVVVVVVLVTSFIQQHASSQESLCDHVASILQPIVVPKQNKKNSLSTSDIKKAAAFLFF